jgi:glycosyltransferase involved in cell wall biosynthesis
LPDQNIERTASLPQRLAHAAEPHFSPQHGMFFEVDLICFSHLRWDFVFQRPQHLLGRCAKNRRVFFWEEPVFTEPGKEGLVISKRDNGLTVVTPYLTHGSRPEQVESDQREMLDCFLIEQNIQSYVCWYYTPMSLAFSQHLRPLAVVYDCMDELSAFKGAPPVLRVYEKNLFNLSDVVFTGGQSLYEAKRDRHPNIHPFPSSIDSRHFARARGVITEPADQAGIPYPRMGFFGVLDERLDRELLRDIANARPDWQFVIVGPVVKIAPEELPHAPNIHYLGSKSYAELPQYIAGWQVALLLFAHNESTRFISPTKTPEYLAAGKPVVSTSIHDVVRPYGERGFARIADSPDEFIKAIEQALAPTPDDWLARVDEFLSHNSWDITWNKMWGLIEEILSRRSEVEQPGNQLEEAVSGD